MTLEHADGDVVPESSGAAACDDGVTMPGRAAINALARVRWITKAISPAVEIHMCVHFSMKAAVVSLTGKRSASEVPPSLSPPNSLWHAMLRSAEFLEATAISYRSSSAAPIPCGYVPAGAEAGSFR
ncbi:Uncharacterized protein MLTONO_5298 [Mesorhizobium loti]|nr:Uncharacterized protein MLTONO_5298 [Mesorhizobium loti]